MVRAPYPRSWRAAHRNRQCCVRLVVLDQRGRDAIVVAMKVVRPWLIPPALLLAVACGAKSGLSALERTHSVGDAGGDGGNAGGGAPAGGAGQGGQTPSCDPNDLSTWV